MCSICKDILVDFAVEHDELYCPVRNSRYCSYCAQYGHLTRSCPAPPPLWAREPVYIEQLIPPSDLKRYNITTLTPIPQHTVEKPPQLLEIKDNDKVIAAYLSARSIKTLKGFTKRKMLEEYAKQQNKRIVFINDRTINKTS
jgi:hypothetical protein